MTIPTRPAPPPPGVSGLNAAAGANASIEQLRLQLQQQQLEQQQIGRGVQKYAIKLPPPPTGNKHNALARNSNPSLNSASSAGSITRKFPQANVRYEPTTDWAGLNFNQQANMNGFKKVPPPRPPPPKCLPNSNGISGKKSSSVLTAALPQTVSKLNNIFQRKKSSKSPLTLSNAMPTQQRSTNSFKAPQVGGTGTGSFYSDTSANIFNNWPSNPHVSFNATAATNNNHTSGQEPQLISFDSPPSSPTFTQKSNSDCLSVDSFSSDSNFSSPNNGSVSQPESGFEDDFTGRSRSTTSPLDPWEALDAFRASDVNIYNSTSSAAPINTIIGTAPVRNLNTINTRIRTSSDNPLCNGKSLLPPTSTLAVPTIIKPKISQKPKAPKPPALRGGPGFNPTLDEVESTTPPSPPMPKCAPPPPPAVSIMDVISGKADALELSACASAAYQADDTPYGIALYDFDSLEDGDLCFRENEKIYLLEKVSEEWYRGRTRSGCEGIFPANYIDIKVPLPANEPKSATNGAGEQNAATTGKNRAPQVKCLYNFPAEVDGDLALKENDLVTILHRINEDWLFGECNGMQGQFPANFLEYVPTNLPES